MASRFSRFLAELRRRKVTRITAVYVIVGLAVIEAASMIFPALFIPDWAYRLVVAVVLLGFPVALVLAWVLEVTPHGIQVTDEASLAEPTTHTPAGWSPAGWVFTLVGLLVVAVGGYLIFFRSAAPELVPNRIVVLPFENQTGEPRFESVGPQAAGWIAGGLDRSDIVEVVPTSLGVLASSAESPTSRPATSRSRIQDVSAETRAGLVIAGSYYLERDTLFFQAEITDVARRTLLASVRSAGSADDRMGSVETLRQRITGALATHMDSRLSGWADAIDPLPSFDAYRAFTQGVEAHVRQATREAENHFLRAVALDSTFVTARIWAAAMSANLGAWARADSLARTVSVPEEELTLSDRWHLEFTRARLQGDLEEAYRFAGLGAQAAPPLWAQYHGGLALNTNRPGEAIEILESLDPDTGLLRGFSSYWRWLCSANYWLGLHEKELSLAREGLRRYPGDSFFLLEEVVALGSLGRVQEMQARIEDIVGSHGVGSTYPAEVLNEAAWVLKDGGYTEEARALSERALEWLERHPDADEETPDFRYRLAEALYAAERWTEARTILEELVAENPQSITYRGKLGTTAARLGDRETAERIEAELAAVDRPYLFGLETGWRARIAAVLGERDLAVRLLRATYEEGQYFPSIRWGFKQDLESLKGYPPYEEFVRPKE